MQRVVMERRGFRGVDFLILILGKLSISRLLGTLISNAIAQYTNSSSLHFVVPFLMSHLLCLLDLILELRTKTVGCFMCFFLKPTSAILILKRK